MIKLTEKQKYQLIFDEGRKYLLDFKKVTEEMLNEYMEPEKKTTMEGIFRQLLESLRNRPIYENIIKVNELEKFLFNFNSKEVLDNYSDWKELYKTIDANEEFVLPDIEGEETVWSKYCKSTIQSAKFLKRFGNNFNKFKVYVNKFYEDKFDRPALAYLIGEEIDGLGFALACDFLKESGYIEYVKVDRHIEDIFKWLNIVGKNASVYKVFRAVVKFAETLEKTPYEVDKLFWLIGSGNFYKHKHIIKKILKTDKKKFVDETLELIKRLEEDEEEE